MLTFDAPAGRPVRLVGSPYARGRAQAERCADAADLVRERIRARLDWGSEGLAEAEFEAYLDRLEAYTRAHFPDILDEIRGIADGFGLTAGHVFRYLAAQVARNLGEGAELAPVDGCSVFAISHPALGALVGKNRDGIAEILPVQRVFHHTDPAWGGRSYVCVGTLGSPGNYSSGMNSDGLVVADTGHRVSRIEVGMHRYFLLTWLLVHCRTVDEALAAIAGMPHVGGGLLALGDAGGTVAAVELGPGRHTGIERKSPGRVGRSNHFVLGATARFNLDLDRWVHRDSPARYRSLQHLLAANGQPELADCAAICSYHEPAGSSICRHGGPDGSHTLSGAIYATAQRLMFYAPGNPCEGQWERFDATAAAPSRAS